MKIFKNFSSAVISSSLLFGLANSTNPANGHSSDVSSSFKNPDSSMDLESLDSSASESYAIHAANNIENDAPANQPHIFNNNNAEKIQTDLSALLKLTAEENNELVLTKLLEMSDKNKKNQFIISVFDVAAYTNNTKLMSELVNSFLVYQSMALTIPFIQSCVPCNKASVLQSIFDVLSRKEDIDPDFLVFTGDIDNISNSQRQVALNFLHIAIYRERTDIINILWPRLRRAEDSSDTPGRSLHIAIKNNNLALVTALLNNDASAWIPFPNTNTLPIHAAAMAGELELMTVLASRFPSSMNALDDSEKTPLIYACENLRVTDVKTLINIATKNNVQFTGIDVSPIHYFVSNGLRNPLQFLLNDLSFHLNNNGDIDSFYGDVMQIAIASNNIAIIDDLIDAGFILPIEQTNNVEFLANCIRQQAMQVIRVALAIRRGDVRFFEILDELALIYQNSGNWKLIYEFVKYGASYSPENIFRDGLLISAASDGNIDLVRQMTDKLLSSDSLVKLDIANIRIAINNATKDHYIDIVELLCKLTPAAIIVTDIDQTDLLYQAVCANKLNLVINLLSRGVSCQYQTANGENLLEIAQRLKFDDVAKCISDAARGAFSFIAKKETPLKNDSATLNQSEGSNLNNFGSMIDENAMNNVQLSSSNLAYSGHNPNSFVLNKKPQVVNQSNIMIEEEKECQSGGGSYVYLSCSEGYESAAEEHESASEEDKVIPVSNETRKAIFNSLVEKIRSGEGVSYRDVDSSDRAITMTDVEGYSLVSHAVKVFDNDSLAILISANANTTLPILSNGNLPIHIACQNGNLVAVQALLDVNESAFINALNAVLNTPLHLAVEHGNISVVKLLLAHGASPTSQNSVGDTPLHLAILFKKNEIYFALMEYFDMVFPQNFNGDTLFHIAAATNNSDILKSLLSYGVSPVVYNDNGKTPIDLVDPFTEAATILNDHYK